MQSPHRHLGLELLNTSLLTILADEDDESLAQPQITSSLQQQQQQHQAQQQAQQTLSSPNHHQEGNNNLKPHGNHQNNEEIEIVQRTRQSRRYNGLEKYYKYRSSVLAESDAGKIYTKGCKGCSKSLINNYKWLSCLSGDNVPDIGQIG